MMHKTGCYEFLDKILAGNEKKFKEKENQESGSAENVITKLYSIRETMTYEEIREEIFAFICGGFDTSGKVIPAALLLLAMNPSVQDKVVDELKSILTEDEEVFEAKLNEMVYLDQVIKEAMRLIPPVIVQSRQATQDIKLSELTAKLNF